MIRQATAVSLNIVPYRSGNDGVNAVLANSVAATSEASIVVLPQIAAGLLKPIATTAEQGFPTVRIGHWAGLFAPRGTPQAIIERMNVELQTAVRSAEVHE